MFTTSEDALADDDVIGLRAATRELERHDCRVLAVEGERLHVTNDCDHSEWIRCSPAAILTYLGY